MLRIVVLFLSALLVWGCQSSSVDRQSENQRYTHDVTSLITHGYNYIELDDSRVKFLFHAPSGATATIFAGSSADNLQAMHTEKLSYTFQGIEAGGFEPGRDYVYKISVVSRGKIHESPLYPLRKQAFSKVKNSRWAKQAVFYHIFVRSFRDSDGDGIGDFNGITEKLDYLQQLGVNALWLLPMFDSPSYHGFDVQDYYAVEPDYGTMQDFENLLVQAEKRGIKIIVDLVVNHSSSEVAWFKDALRGEDSPYRHYYTWLDQYGNIDESGPWGQMLWSPVKDDKDRITEAYLSTFVGEMPDLNLRSPEVRQEIKKVAKFWLDKGVDGFRLDASRHIDDMDMTVTHRWWKEFNQFVKSVDSDAFLVGEAWYGNNEEIAPFFADMDSSFNFPMNKALIKAAQGDSIELQQMMQKLPSLYGDVNRDYIDSIFITNHDLDRVSYHLKPNRERTRLAASLLLTMPGTPFIYYGDELGQRGHYDHVRLPFEWYAANAGTGMTTWRKSSFNRADDGISVEEQQDDPNSLLNHYRKLIEVRKAHPALFRGKYKIRSCSLDLLCYSVKKKGTNLFVIHNLTDKPQQYQFSKEGLTTKDLLTEQQFESTILLAPLQSRILVPE